MLKSDTEKAEKLIKLMGGYKYLITLGAHSIQLDNCGLHYSHSAGSHSFYTRVLRDGPNVNHVLVYAGLGPGCMRIKHCREHLADDDLAAVVREVSGVQSLVTT